MGILFEKDNFDYDKITELSKNIDDIFTSNSDINKTAFLNWRFDKIRDSKSQLIEMGAAYFDTAKFLLNECLINNVDKKADAWIFPILFNIVHALELNLKAINACFYYLNEGVTKIIGGHNIKQLAEDSLKLLDEYKEKEQDNINELKECLCLIHKFTILIFNKTSDMTFSRYPINKDKQKQFYNASLCNVVIDLERLYFILPYLEKCSEMVYDMLSMNIEYKQEYEREMEQLYGDYEGDYDSYNEN